MANSSKSLSRILGGGHHIGELTEEMIIQGIMNRSEKIIALLYKEQLPRIKSLVWSFHNMVLDAEDIFQDGFTIAIMNISNGKFRGESSFSTYLNSICRNICLKKLSQAPIKEFSEAYDKMEEVENHDLIQKLMELRSKLDQKCREIIDLRFTLGGKVNDDAPNKCLSFDEIGEYLGLTTDNARQRFKRCLDGFRNMVMASNDMKEHYYSI